MCTTMYLIVNDHLNKAETNSTLSLVLEYAFDGKTIEHFNNLKALLLQKLLKFIP